VPRTRDFGDGGQRLDVEAREHVRVNRRRQCRESVDSGCGRARVRRWAASRGAVGAGGHNPTADHVHRRITNTFRGTSVAATKNPAAADLQTKVSGRAARAHTCFETFKKTPMFAITRVPMVMV
jgi:hypothetical protein